MWPAVSALLVALMGCLVAGCAPSSAKPATSPTARAATYKCSAAPSAAPQANALAQVVCQALKPLTPHIASVATTYDAQRQTVQAQVTFSNDVPTEPDAIKVAQERVKVVCFLVQRALWTRTAASAIPLQSVTVVTLGLTQDDYGDKVIAGYGGAELTAATSAHFDWPTLTADSAWTRYNFAALTPDYAPFHRYGAP